MVRLSTGRGRGQYTPVPRSTLEDAFTDSMWRQVDTLDPPFKSQTHSGSLRRQGHRPLHLLGGPFYTEEETLVFR